MRLIQHKYSLKSIILQSYVRDPVVLNKGTLSGIQEINSIANVESCHSLANALSVNALVADAALVMMR